jgi:hypothetical protein
MGALKEQIEEIRERTLREANALPREAARERRAQGLNEARRAVASKDGVPLLSAPDLRWYPSEPGVRVSEGRR